MAAWILLATIGAALLPLAPLPAQPVLEPLSPPQAGEGREVRPALTAAAPHAMVAVQEARAARIGGDVLQRGGNAVDAAVAIGFALAVTYPRAGNIGGGGYMVIHLADRGIDTTIDYRETAPSAVTRETFLDASGEVEPKKSRDSALAIGVPGTVAGLALAQAKYGSGHLSLAELVRPAIALAREGFPVENDIADSLPRALARLARWPSTAKIFLAGELPREGALLRQPDLATTLTAIADRGPSAFYDGAVAEKVVSSVQGAGGLMTREDLRSYRPIEREPVRSSYRGYEIVSMPPSSAGGVILLEMLNILEGFDLRGDAELRAHRMIESMKLAYADRAHFLGDPASVEVPVERLLSKSYAAQLRGRIGERALPAEAIRSPTGLPDEGKNTTHFSVVDGAGNAVANTYTLNFSYGVGLVAEGTGVLLNNELDDFAVKPGVPNAFGLTGADANAPAGGKRPLSSMSPTIVLDGSHAFLVTGSPGGSHITTAVLQVIVNVIDRKMPLADAVTEPRMHDQWLPDEVMVETAFSPALAQALEARGHHVARTRPRTSANSILVTPDGVIGAADGRTRGGLAVGY